MLSLNKALQKAKLEMPHTRSGAFDLPIIYIVGSPRSGTTLLYQLLCQHLSVSYINNLIARFWLRPSVGILLSRAVLDENRSSTIDLKSTHGTTKGIEGPHEFGYFWRHWLKLDQAPTHHLSERALRLVDAEGLKHALEHEILGSFQRPVVMKNVICGFHAEFLTKIHAASLFVHIMRDPMAAALSILKTRHERFGKYDVWWSLKPSSYPFKVAEGDVGAEVATQVMECRREIEVELRKPGVASICVSYEELCSDTQGVVLRISEGLASKGFGHIEAHVSDIQSLTVTGPSSVPHSIEMRVRQCIDDLLSTGLYLS